MDLTRTIEKKETLSCGCYQLLGNQHASLAPKDLCWDCEQDRNKQKVAATGKLVLRKQEMERVAKAFAVLARVRDRLACEEKDDRKRNES